jgi:hypothetical protein
MVAASYAAVTKDSGSRGAHTDEQVGGAVFASAQDPPVQVETSPGPKGGVLDVMLLEHPGVVDGGNVCGLLTECLQDVSLTVLVLCIFASYCFVLSSRLFFDRLFL